MPCLIPPLQWCKRVEVCPALHHPPNLRVEVCPVWYPPSPGARELRYALPYITPRIWGLKWIHLSLSRLWLSRLAPSISNCSWIRALQNSQYHQYIWIICTYNSRSYFKERSLMPILCLKQLNIEKCDQEFIKENKKVRKQENTLSTKKTTKKKKRRKTVTKKKRKNFIFFLIVSWSRACFLSFFLTFLFSFINTHLRWVALLYVYAGDGLLWIGKKNIF